MGIDFDEERRLVHYNPNHENRVNTSAISNPQEFEINGRLAWAIFQRRKSKSKNRIYGDGNPLIYALKKVGGTRIDSRSYCQLDGAVQTILAKLQDKIEADLIVPMPSSSPLPACIAAHVRETICDTAKIIHPFAKRSIGETLTALPAPNDIPRSLRKDFKSAIGALGKADPQVFFEMKKIGPKIRHLFQPIRLQRAAAPPPGSKVVLVDDQITSGTTIKSALRELADLDIEEISIIFLLGPLDRKILG